MIIRSEQLNKFQPEAEKQFVQKVSEYIRKEYSNSVIPFRTGDLEVKQISNELLQKMVRSSINRAIKHGIDWESAIVAFVSLMFLTAPNFDHHSVFQKILESSEIEPNLKIDKLTENSTEEDWQTVQQNYDIKEWYL